MTKPARLPKALKLKKHIDSATVAELKEFLRFWSPHEKVNQPRAELTRKLDRLMADENVVYAKVELLSEKVRTVLLQLLRKTHYTSDLQGLFRGLEGLEMEYYEGEAALTALARRGFVRMHRSPEWQSNGRGLYSIPREIALVMRGLAGADQRPFEEIFVHESFRPSSVERLDDETVGDVPDDVHAAIAQLEGEHLQTIARTVLGTYGGLLTRREFGDVFAPHGIRWASAEFLRAFGAAGLGTVGHIDLQSRGLGVDDDVLVFFSEAVERFAAEERSATLEYDTILTAHGDLISDVRTVLGMTRETTLRVAKDGALYKASMTRIAEKLQFPRQAIVDRDEIAHRVVSIVRGLSLADSNGERRLNMTESGEAWLPRPLLDKVRDCYELFQRAGSGTLRDLHLMRLRAILIDMLTDEAQRDFWWPCPSLSMLARNRYLLQLTAAEERPHHAPLAISPAALTELGRAAQDVLLRELFPLGLVDVAVRGDEPVAVHLSGLGRRLLCEEAVESDAARPLVVNPDFEILVLPEGNVDELLHNLDRYAERTRTGEVVGYRLDRKKIERAAAEGEPPERVLELLENHSRAAVPQNVVYSVRSWAGSVQSGSLAQGTLFTASDPAVVEMIRTHPALKEGIVRVIDPVTIFFDAEFDEARLAQELRNLGLYLQ
ncbi:MAG: helicase-associated domain-containing protein [Planctomycetota bacterium]